MCPFRMRKQTSDKHATGCMADIQSSLQRLQESIRGLSDASALVGALDVEVGENEAVAFEEEHGAGTSVSPPLQQPAAFSPRKHRRHRRHGESVGGSGGAGLETDRRSSLGSSGGPPTHDEEQSLLSSIPRELRDSAEV